MQLKFTEVITNAKSIAFVIKQTFICSKRSPLNRYPKCNHYMRWHSDHLTGIHYKRRFTSMSILKLRGKAPFLYLNFFPYNFTNFSFFFFCCTFSVLLFFLDQKHIKKKKTSKCFSLFFHFFFFTQRKRVTGS